MNLDELETYVVKRLSAGVAVEDVILEVTTRGELDWPEARDLVRRTADLHGPSVARRQFPLLALLAVAAMIGGTATLVACFLSFSGVLTILQPVRGLTDQERIAALLALLATNSPMLSLIPLGIGMILGGAIGLARTIQELEPAD
jgi:hypothetical protein